jgi:thiol-disulfide isomerase/thioredoxin
MTASFFLTVVLLFCGALFAAPSASAGDDIPVATPAPLRAGEIFSGGKGWINTEVPLSDEMLKGHVVLVDFWTYCCINCIHVIPDLKFLEEKYKDQPFIVVGVHSGKFDHEKDPANIRAAVMRYTIEHPVVVDSDFNIWKRFGTNSWPTVALIDSTGKPIGKVSGEGHRQLLDETIAKLLEEGRANGTLTDKPLKFKMEKDTSVQGPLLYPGKVLVDGERQRIFIADTGHHRILETSLEGKVTRIIGSGKPAIDNGEIAQASFHEPQGMTLSADGKLLYIADRLNHALREVDLTTNTVRTLSGNGEQGRLRRYNGPADKAQLNSPWDIERVGNIIYMAMAGSHQMWRYHIDSNTIAVHAGTGAESCENGPLAESTFSQPSGIATDGTTLFIADSEDSTIRGVAADPAGVVTSIAGSEDLFGFGLKDGTGKQALFQHPLCVERIVTANGPLIIVADTYNHVLRSVDLATGMVATLPMTGLTPGMYEPSGISADKTHLYVADTNRHRIVIIPHAGGEARVLTVTLPE